MGDACNLCVLLRHALGRVNDQNDHIRTLHGRYGTNDAVAFQILFDLAFTAQSGGINKDILRSVVYDLGIDRITGGTCNIGNDHTVLTQQLINNRRLSYVRLTDNGYLRTVILFFL